MKKCRWKTDELVAKSSEIKPTVLTYRGDLETRMEATVIDSFVADSSTLRDSSRVTTGTQVAKKAATERQNQSLREAAIFLRTRRNAVRKEFIDDKALQHSFGIGTRFTTSSPSSVTAALEAFVSAAKAHPSKALLAGILPQDVSRLEQYIDGLDSGEESQEGSKGTAKASTTSRKALQLKVEKNLIKIVTTAELVFEDRPEVLALFRSALPSSRSRKPRDKQPDEKPTP